MKACLSAREDRESSFHRSVGPLRFMQAGFCAVKTSYSCFILRLGTVKHVEASLSAREDQESSFHRCGGTVRLVHAFLFSGKT